MRIRNWLVLLVSVTSSVACGPGAPTLPFRPSNLPADFAFTAAGDVAFNGDQCGPRAEIDTDQAVIQCFEPGVFNPKFQYAIKKDVRQSDGSEIAVLVARNIRLEPNNELQIRGSRPLVLVALDKMVIAGRVTAFDPVLKYAAHAGGASEPSGSRVAGLGAGGGKPGAGDAAGAGGGSYCGIGGKGGDDTSPALAGGEGGPKYGTPEIVPLRGGSSGGRNGNHAGAGGGAIQLVAGTSVEITSEGSVNMGGSGGGWYGNGGGSGGAILVESTSINVAGTLAANGGGGGGGASAGGEDGASATANATPAAGGAGGASGGAGGAGSAGNEINGAPGGSTSGQAGGGGGGAGWIRLNTSSGAATVTGVVSPGLTTACATQGTVAAK